MRIDDLRRPNVAHPRDERGPGSFYRAPAGDLRSACGKIGRPSPGTARILQSTGIEEEDLVKRKIIRTAAATLLLTLAAGGAGAQTLLEVARREKARRDAIPPGERSRIYTNDDLRDSGGLTIGALPAADLQEADAGTGYAGRGVDDSGAATGPVAAETGDLPGEDDWRARATAARQARERAELMASALQNRADGLWAQFTGMDDPARRRVVERQRAETLAELERTQAEAERFEREVRDIREAARRAGVPPGWLR